MSCKPSFLETNSSYLLSPLTSLASLKLSNDHILLFAESQLHVGENLCALIEAVQGTACSFCVSFYFPERAEYQSAKIFNCDDLRSLCQDTDFLSDFYMAGCDGNFLIYHSARDDFTVVAVGSSLISEEDLCNWDREFSLHIGSSGIGFGKAGELYARELLGELPLDRRRRFIIRRRER